MSATYGTRALEEPLNATMKSDEGLDRKGLLLRITDVGTDNTLRKVLAADPDAVEIQGVGVDDTKNATTGNVENGRPVSFLRHGIVPVAVEAGTYTRGDYIWASASADGQGVASAAGSDVAGSLPIGKYVPADGVDSEVISADDVTNLKNHVQVDLDADVGLNGRKTN